MPKRAYMLILQTRKPFLSIPWDMKRQKVEILGYFDGDLGISEKSEWSRWTLAGKLFNDC